MKRLLIRTDPDAGKDWSQEEKGTTEDEMVGWHHQLNGHESEQALGDDEGQGSPCSPWGCKELDMTEWLNSNDKTWTDKKLFFMDEQRKWFLEMESAVGEAAVKLV